MASNLRVDNIQPTTGTGIGIGTANGSVTFNADVTGGMNITTGSLGVGINNTTTTGFSRTIRVKGSSTSSGVSGLFAESYAGSAWFGFYSGSSTTDTPALLYPYNGALRIGTTNSVGTSGFAERLRLTSAGNLKFVTPGTGIDFSATADGSGTTDSELLNDYEEGTFTPSLTFATPGTASFSYSVQSGWYIKIGRMVHYRIELRLTAFSKGTASGDLRISGLPFTTVNLGSGQFTGSFAGFNAPLPSTAGHFPFFGARINNTEGFFKVVRNNNGWTTFPDPDANAQYKCDVTVFTV